MTILTFRNLSQSLILEVKVKPCRRCSIADALSDNIKQIEKSHVMCGFIEIQNNRQIIFHPV